MIFNRFGNEDCIDSADGPRFAPGWATKDETKLRSEIVTCDGKKPIYGECLGKDGKFHRFGKWPKE